VTGRLGSQLLGFAVGTDVNGGWLEGLSLPATEDTPSAWDYVVAVRLVSVHPLFQRKGYGNLLVEDLLRLGGSWGMTRVPVSNTGAQHAFSRWGWYAIAHLEGGLTSMVMVKPRIGLTEGWKPHRQWC
jgi:GNAT superfamily N-acetyltransferase